VVGNHLWFLNISWAHSIIPFTFGFSLYYFFQALYHYVCDFKKINLCEVEKGCTCVKKKYKQWIMVEGQLVISFLLCFSLIFQM
jgi:hypothetical protein